MHDVITNINIPQIKPLMIHRFMPCVIFSHRLKIMTCSQEIKQIVCCLSIFRIVEIPSFTIFPILSGIAIGGVAFCLLKELSKVQEVVGHKRGVSVSKLVLNRARFFIQIAGAGAYFTQPTTIGLGRYGVANVL